MDILTILYILAGIAIFCSVIWRIRNVTEKYDEAMDLLNVMRNWYRKISILKNACDAAKNEISVLIAQYNKENIRENPDHTRINETVLSYIIENDDNNNNSGVIVSGTLQTIQTKKEKLEISENELDQIACYYNLYVMRLKNIKNRFPLVAFMIADEIQNMKAPLF
ncbi:MAG TPA: hypothetical protein VE912_21660 [Bacteroidales bacterium]|nr:hypothetical protein [Bacteroidales bacterium]